MKIVNRGFISIKPKKAFFDWANQFDEEIYFDENDEVEPSIYLIEDDFLESEQIIKMYFQEMISNEFMMVTDRVNDHPRVKENELANWFELTLGTTVFDALSNSLERFQID